MTRELPPDARRSLLLYNLFFPLVLVGMLPGLILRMVRRGNFREKFGQRFGQFSDADRATFVSGRWIWVHSISVGETLLALRLVRRMLELDKDISIVISVTTTTGFAVADRHRNGRIAVIYNPVDFPPIVRRTLSIINPERLIFIEAIWPNLLAQCKRRGLSIGFVPRMSPRSERRFRRFRSLTGPLFRLIDTLTVADGYDISRWLALGVDRAQCLITGNIKYDQEATPPADITNLRDFLTRLGVAPERPIILAGSTFAGEETIVANAIIRLRDRHPALFGIIVPRHVERTPTILKELEPTGLNIALRTAAPADDSTVNPCDLLIVNTTGELRDWYHLATLVFIGKSITSKGGQNPVEPVLAGKPVLFGPNMQNFEPLASQWTDNGAAVRVQNSDDLISRCDELLGDPSRRDAMAAKARQSLEHHRGATIRSAKAFLATRQRPESGTPKEN